MITNYNKMLVVGIASLMLLTLIVCCDGCFEEERNGLLQLKAFINFPNRTSLPTWGLHSNCCDWEYVLCSSTGHVVQLYLWGLRDSSSEKWYLNASLFLSFQYLKTLRLDENNIGGCVENEGFERLSALKTLETLDLYENSLNNTELSSLNNLVFLKYLNLGYNQLEGTVNMEELKALTKLERLYLDGNRINKLVASQGYLPSLKSLVLMDNHELKEIVNVEGYLPSLKHLTLSDNHELKEIMSYFPSLKYLGLISNNELQEIENAESLSKLEGFGLDGNAINEIVTSNASFFNHFNKLASLVISGSNVSTHLLESIGSIPTLKELYMLDCNLKGATRSLGRYGVFPYFKKLTRLYLSSSTLSSHFLQNIGNITTLEVLYMTDCTVVEASQLDTGSFSHFKNLTYLELYNFTASNHFLQSISTMATLQYLTMQECNFTNEAISIGIILPLKKLTYLDLSFSTVNNDVLRSIGNITTLEHLNLGNCNLNLTIPTGLCRLDRLNELYMTSNNLIGTLPFCMGNLTSLRHLHLSGNNLTGNLPLSTTNFPFNHSTSSSFGVNFPETRLTSVDSSVTHQRSLLEEIDLSNNQFFGEILKQLSLACSELFILTLSDNHLYGNIPNDLSKCSQLKVLDLKNNDLSGQIPSWLSSMPYLKVLDLSNNHFSGNIPHGFNPPSIEQVLFSRNQLQGRLDDIFYDCSYLKKIDFSHNYFTGVIPRWIGKLLLLKHLKLSYNELEGDIPTLLCKLDQLALIDFSHNGLSGQIPSCLKVSNKWLPNYDPFHNRTVEEPLAFTMKSFSYLYEGDILSQMCGIDLSCNNFTGYIPSQIGNFIEIKVLNLSHNSLMGQVPTTFSNLRNIESLDLSYNNLSGHIPSQLKSLYSLAVFSVAHNNLSGRTPDRVFQFATFGEESYIGNRYLCGEPLKKSCKTMEEPLSPVANTLKEEKSDGLIDMNVFYVSFSVTYVIILLGIIAALYINSYWRQAWFHFIEESLTNFYYFVVDNLPVPIRYKV